MGPGGGPRSSTPLRSVALEASGSAGSATRARVRGSETRTPESHSTRPFILPGTAPFVNATGEGPNCHGAPSALESEARPSTVNWSLIVIAEAAQDQKSALVS